MTSPCISTTAAGNRCKLPALMGNEYCGTHAWRGEVNNRTCPTCHIRHHVRITKGFYAPSMMSQKEWVWLVNAAATFDKESGDERFTASEFVAWVRPEVGRRVPVPGPETDGKSRIEHGFKTGTKATRHGQPDPLPFLDRRRVA